MSEGQGIVFLQKDKFDFYSPGLTRIVEFRFVPDIIRDLEVVNAELLENLIKLFVTSNKAIPGDLIIVLSDNTSFVKDFVSSPLSNSQNPQNQNQSPSTGDKKDPQTGEQPKKVDEQINDFIENVPFENVAYKKFPIANGFKVLATNKDFFMAIKNAFEKSGFKVNSVLPGIVFGANVSSKQALDTVGVNIIIQQSGAQGANNLLVEEKKTQAQEVQKKQNTDGMSGDYIVPEQTVQEKPKTNKTRIIAMLAVFCVLIIILIYMVINPPS